MGTTDEWIVAGVDLGSVSMTATELNRLRWRCRRGMLENDLILARFMDARGLALTEQQVAALEATVAEQTAQHPLSEFAVCGRR